MHLSMLGAGVETLVGPWQILATCPRGLLLVAVEEWRALGVLYGAPPSFPMVTRRLLHHWTPDKPLPAALSLL
jgi:hypothetical protein